MTQTSSSFAERSRRWLQVLIGPVLLAAVAYVLSRQSLAADYNGVIQTLSSTPSWKILAALVLTGLSFATLTFYDFNAFRAIGRPRRWREIAPGAGAAFAISQSVGFGPLSGGAVRMRFYLPLGVSPGDVAKVVAFVTVSFGLGLKTVFAVAALANASQLSASIGVSPGLLRTLGIVLLGGLVLVFSFAGRELKFDFFGPREVTLPSREIVLSQIAVIWADLATSGGVLWILLPSGTVDYGVFIPIFAVAVALGVLSHVPAGLGIFEATILFALKDAAPASQVIAALALYRLIYTALPVIVATVAIVISEVLTVARDPTARAIVAASAGLAPQLLAAFALLLGAMLVFSGVTPANPADLDWLASLIPLHLLEGAHFIASVLGAVLLICARGLAYRLDGAWAVALGAATIAIVLSLAKALAVYEAVALAAFCLLLLASRQRFDRPAAILNQTLTPQWIAAIAAVLISAFVIFLFAYDYSEYGVDSWATFEVSGEAPRGLRALIGAALVLGIAGFWSLLGHAVPPLSRPSADDLAKAVQIVEGQAAGEANLVRMGDKSLMFSEDGRGFLMYARQGQSWIALFDPVGPVEVWRELVWRFVETARLSGGRAAFYQVGAENLSVYADAGLSCLKLGEEARVDLQAFSLEGADRKDLRYARSRGVREGLDLKVLEPAEIPAVFDQLEAISQTWLTQRGASEKSFSLGAFLRSYVLQQRVAVLRRNGEIIAFATLMETHLGEEAVIDMMRHQNNIPGVAMEFLFLKLIEHFKERGVRWFVLGIAPLSGLSDSEAAPAWHRIGRTVFDHGSRTYNFKGLRSFKERFGPVWRPRYLAVSGGLSPAIVLLDATRLIGSGIKEAKP